MTFIEKACDFFLKILLEWEVFALDSMGISIGVLSIWNPRVFKINTFTSSSGVLLIGFTKGLEGKISVLNVNHVYNFIQNVRQLHLLKYFDQS